jgi:hypothetical protein
VVRSSCSLPCARGILCFPLPFLNPTNPLLPALQPSPNSATAPIPNLRSAAPMEDPPPPDPLPEASPPREEVDPSPPPPASPAPAPPRRLLRLRCAVQHYEWGRRGAASFVARLAGNPDADPARPYAELWMGTHPSAPSKLLDDGTLLKDWLARNPHALGPAVAARWGGDLPFLFKVLHLQVDQRFRAFPASARFVPSRPLTKLGDAFATAGAVGGEGALDPGAPGQEARRGAARAEPVHLQGRQPQAGDGHRRHRVPGALWLCLY